MSWDLVVILARGSAWMALAISALGLLWIGLSGEGIGVGPDQVRRRDVAARLAIDLVIAAAIWVVIAYAVGGGMVNP